MSQVIRQIRLACDGTAEDVKHLGENVWYVKSSCRSPFRLADAIERGLGCQIELDWSDPDQMWKASGAWRGFDYSHLRFQVPAAIMEGVFVEDHPVIPPADDFVYFIDAGEQIKIGRSANPLRRMETLQASTGTMLSLALVLPDGDREREFHDRFAVLRVRGEWFQKGEELLSFIEEEKARPSAPPS